MQMLCKVSAMFSDLRCPVCDQGFLVYWTRQRAGEQEEQGPYLQQALRAQHTGVGTAEAHPPAFQVAEAAVAAPRHRSPAVGGAVPVYQ